MLEATNSGWQIKPTSRSEAAKQPKRMKDGELRSRFFPIANRIRKFPKKFMRKNKQLRIHVMIFVIKTSSSWSKIATLYSKKKQDLSVLFMTKKVPCSASNKTQWTAGPKFPRHSPLSPFLFLYQVGSPFDDNIGSAISYLIHLKQICTRLWEFDWQRFSGSWWQHKNKLQLQYMGWKFLRFHRKLFFLFETERGLAFSVSLKTKSSYNSCTRTLHLWVALITSRPF